MDEVQLNTLYVMTDGAYLHRDGQTVVVEINKSAAARIPIHMLESIACFGNIMASPQVMELAATSGVAMSFLSAGGRMVARVDPPGSSWVKLRKKQFAMQDDEAFKLRLCKNIVAGKVQNCRQNLMRSARDAGDGESAEKLRGAAEWLMGSIESLERANTCDEVRGVEGDAARAYFEQFALMTPEAAGGLRYVKRTRQPPLDAVNALLSLFYSILTNDCAAAVSAAGLEASAGYLHEDRPGRPSLALDLMEEFRPVLVDRFVMTLINRKQVGIDDFIERPGGAVELKDGRRKELVAAYQQRKQELETAPLSGAGSATGALAVPSGTAVGAAYSWRAQGLCAGDHQVGGRLCSCWFLTM